MLSSINITNIQYTPTKGRNKLFMFYINCLPPAAVVLLTSDLKGSVVLQVLALSEEEK